MERLHEVINRYTLASESVRLGIIDFTSESDVLILDGVAMGLLGLRRDAGSVFSLDDFCALVRPQECCLVKDFLSEAERGSEPAREVEFMVSRVTPERWLRLTLRNLRNREGQITRSIACLQDITPSKQYERALVEARERAEQASRTKSDLLAMVSHELRTPLNAICGFAELLNFYDLESDAKAYLHNILESGRHLEKLIGEILDFARLGNGGLREDIVQLDLLNVTEEVDVVGNIIRPMAEVKGLKFVVELSPALPLEIRSDAKRFRQILLNLLSNAVKFTPSGYVKLTVDFEHHQEDAKSTLQLKVEDSGIGIEPERLPEIFEPFRQVDSGPRRNYGGIGMGLALVKRLLECLHGTISCSSTPGVGSCFTVRLPLDLQLSGAVGFSAPHGDRKAAARILCAEDNAANQVLMRSLLENLGHAVLVVADGLEAIESLKRQPCDLVLMDIHMPVLDGLRATHLIREGAAGEICQHIPILGITAFALEGDRERCLGAGMNGYLRKPVRLRELAQVIEEYARAGRGLGR